MEKCESCGRDFADHPGIMATCRELKLARDKSEKYEQALRGCYQMRMWPDEVRHIVEEALEIRSNVAASQPALDADCESP